MRAEQSLVEEALTNLRVQGELQRTEIQALVLERDSVVAILRDFTSRQRDRRPSGGSVPGLPSAMSHVLLPSSAGSTPSPRLNLAVGHQAVSILLPYAEPRAGSQSERGPAASSTHSSAVRAAERGSPFVALQPHPQERGSTALPSSAEGEVVSAASALAIAAPLDPMTTAAGSAFADGGQGQRARAVKGTEPSPATARSEIATDLSPGTQPDGRQLDRQQRLSVAASDVSVASTLPTTASVSTSGLPPMSTVAVDSAAASMLERVQRLRQTLQTMRPVAAAPRSSLADSLLRSTANTAYSAHARRARQPAAIHVLPPTSSHLSREAGLSGVASAPAPAKTASAAPATVPRSPARPHPSVSSPLTGSRSLAARSPPPPPVLFQPTPAASTAAALSAATSPSSAAGVVTPGRQPESQAASSARRGRSAAGRKSWH
jgi:hypothetical protein